MNRSIMYWKWDNDVLDLSIMDKKADDLVSRTKIGNIFMGTQWIVDHFHGEKIGAAFRRSIEKMHAAGRKAMIECCIRNEGEPFYKKYPGEPSYLVSFYEGQADADGKGTFKVPAEPVWHYWRKRGDDGEHKVFCAHRLKKTGDFAYSGAVRCDENVQTKIEKNGDGYEICVSFTGAEAGETVAVAIGFPQPIVDLAHPMLIPYFRDMVKHAKELGADGVFSDEWGYDMILKISEPNPYDDHRLSLRHVSYSVHFEKKHREITGEPLLENLLALFYTDGARPAERVAAVNRYIKTLRLICTQNEDEMYAAVKEIMGPDAFWGVHPTWWGSVDKLNFEFFKNGFYWWDAKRDYAQTDETITYPIRTALAHRFSSPVWYNMWYSMGTRDINTYYPESWNNLRYGGRTHYLGYECPNEAVVLELKPAGMLESIEEMDARIRMYDGVCSQPDCRLLVLFGFESVSNWADIGMEMPWPVENPRLDKVLNTAHALFKNVLCDLVPSYAAENGSLYLNEKGKTQYGTQEYDAVFVLFPGGMSAAAQKFVGALDPANVAVFYEEETGDAESFAKSLAAKGVNVRKGVPSVEELTKLAGDMGVPANRFENGTVCQSGALIFTADGKLPAHNPLKLDFEWKGSRVVFEGEDSLWLSRDLDKAIFPAGKLTVNGKNLTSCEEAK